MGVAQGSKKGPLLSIVYMNDIPNAIQNFILYADGTNLRNLVLFRFVDV